MQDDKNSGNFYTNNKNKNIININKTLHDTFRFFINCQNNNELNFIHDLLCLPAIPLIGKYNKNFYDFSNVLSLVTFEFDLKDLESDQFSSDINFPKNLLEFVNNEIQNIENINYNCKFTDEDLKYIKLIKGIQNVNFYWITSFNSIDKGYDSNYNIVSHNFLFKEINFEHRKRIVKNYPICIYLDESMKNNSGVFAYNNEIEENNNKKTAINFNNLRMEFSSTHLSKNSLSFSPNNLKFIIDKNKEIISFYTIIIYNDSIHIFYNWYINSFALNEKLDKIFSDSINILEVIKKVEFLRDIFEIGDCLEFIKKLFNYSK
jgi:hypothetical protein